MLDMPMKAPGAGCSGTHPGRGPQSECLAPHRIFRTSAAAAPPGARPMFDDVYDEKLWKKNRDATGLKGTLTEKVSMGEEFKRFQQKKDATAAKILLQKITLYETQLKNKHSKEKYYTKLLKVVQDQKAA